MRWFWNFLGVIFQCHIKNVINLQGIRLAGLFGSFTSILEILKPFNFNFSIFDMLFLSNDLLKTIVNQPKQFEGNYQIPVNLSDLPNGIYLVTLINNDKRFTERLIIEK